MKNIISLLLVASILASTPAPASPLIADNTEMLAQDDSGTEDQDSTPEDGISIYSPPQEATAAEVTPSDEEEEGTPVGQASNEGARAARNQQWRNIALAVAAVAVAVTALLLVASNDGRHHKHKHEDK
jgi:hypothetical protein